MWDYVYYSLYLDSIDTGDHNAIQKYVYEQVSIIRKIIMLFSYHNRILYNYNHVTLISPFNVYIMYPSIYFIYHHLYNYISY